MNRVCFVLKVRQECVDEYRKRHQEIWPEMRAALQQSGWHDYSLFLRSDGLLVGTLLTDSFQSARDAMQSLEVNTRWQQEMAPLFEGNGVAVDQQMEALEQVFYLP